MGGLTKFLNYARFLRLFIKRFGIWGLAPFKKGLLVAILSEKKLIPMNQNGFYLLRRKFELYFLNLRKLWYP
jgi:hypothetical protein